MTVDLHGIMKRNHTGDKEDEARHKDSQRFSGGRGTEEN